MPTLELDSGLFGYDDTGGTGAVVVLSHAGLADRRMWRSQRAALSSHFRVISYDRLGFGESGPAPELVHPAEDLLRLLDVLGIQQAAVVGCSIGAGYGVAAALLAPDRVTALGLICPGIPGYHWPDAMLDEVRPLMTAAVPQHRLSTYASHSASEVRESDIDAMADMQLRYMALGGRNRSTLRDELWGELMDMARGVFRREWTEPASSEPEPTPAVLDRLDELDVPTLIISAACDVVFVRRLAIELAHGIRGARLVELADTGHLPPVERPDAVNALVTSFLLDSLPTRVA